MGPPCKNTAHMLLRLNNSLRNHQYAYDLKMSDILLIFNRRWPCRWKTALKILAERPGHFKYVYTTAWASTKIFYIGLKIQYPLLERSVQAFSSDHPPRFRCGTWCLGRWLDVLNLVSRPPRRREPGIGTVDRQTEADETGRGMRTSPAK